MLSAVMVVVASYSPVCIPATIVALSLTMSK